jgi:hypothetical protein
VWIDVVLSWAEGKKANHPSFFQKKNFSFFSEIS